MRRLSFVLGLVAAGGLCLGVRAWLSERNRRSVFPASDAGALLNPARRLIQSAEGTVRAFGLKPGDAALEIGPGPGYFSPHAVDAVGPDGRLICLDIQREMLVLLRERLAGQRSQAQLVVGDATRLPFRESALDAVLVIEMLGEVPDPQAAVGEVRRVLRSNGTASFCEAMNDPDYVRLPVLRELCTTAGLRSLGWRRQLLGYVARFRPEQPSAHSQIGR